MRRVATLAFLTACLSVTSTALADSASWMHFAGGTVAWKGGSDTPDGYEVSPMMVMDMGMGSDFHSPFIFGGYFRIQPQFDRGADLALMGRFASRGFQTDWIGFAFDAGAYQRFWGIGSSGFLGQATLGGPFGLQLAALGSVGTNDSHGFGGTLGIDLARLTVFRDHGTTWWKNPRPYQSTREQEALLALPRF